MQYALFDLPDRQTDFFDNMLNYLNRLDSNHFSREQHLSIFREACKLLAEAESDGEIKSGYYKFLLKSHAEGNKMR